MIIDLTAVDFLASHGVGVLIGISDCLRGGAGFAVVANGPATSRPLRLLGVDSKLSLHATLDGAVHAVRPDLGS